MFMGEYNHTIDSKGRFILPAKFREDMTEGMIITRGLDGCLYIYQKNEWKVFEEKLKKLPLTKKSSRQFVRFFMAGACECDVDKQGRVLIPVNLREYANIDKDIVIVGVINKIEIWNQQTWKESNEEYEDMDVIAEQMEEFDITL
ncbi:MraZ protein [Acetitomaculum ruminis DSM 5522]|uniref:Transcriptional regulator MraZ n=1 Tax=Acetitomaculum ruminis DSM 5522 TaxID=1120918 RepID=A0A1I0VWI5_9FIRM|nr:division/cell wall cluster transcriptional repressor MraZ [Acetitomaculum ruminis]SFA80253.1 MraZ protein [Acetitomaculum ruminis DSM 5522]